MNLDFVAWDIETSNLNADFSTLLCSCVKPFGRDPIVHRIDDICPGWKYGKRKEDKEIVQVVVNELKQHAVIVTHYGCLTLGHKVLTADLRWVAVETLKVGDKLLAFDDNAKKQKRHWRMAEVTHTGVEIRDVYKISLSDGSSLIATPDHKWLTPQYNDGHYIWVETKDLKVGRQLLRILPVWKGESRYAEGYLAGFFDGEGDISQYARENGRGEYTFNVNVTRNPNAAITKAQKCLKDSLFNSSTYPYDPSNPNIRAVRINGGTQENLRFLGQIRPDRLLKKFDINKLGSIRDNRHEFVKITSVVPLNKQSVVTLGTSTGTYIAEGFLTHNTGFDLPYLKAKMVRYGIELPRPLYMMDTYWIAKSNLKVSRRRLESLAEYFFGEGKSKVNGETWMEAAMNGDSVALDKIVQHNITDCILLEKLASALFPFVKSMRRQ